MTHTYQRTTLGTIRDILSTVGASVAVAGILRMSPVSSSLVISLVAASIVFALLSYVLIYRNGVKINVVDRQLTYQRFFHTIHQVDLSDYCVREEVTKLAFAPDRTVLWLVRASDKQMLQLDVTPLGTAQSRDLLEVVQSIALPDAVQYI